MLFLLLEFISCGLQQKLFYYYVDSCEFSEFSGYCIS